MTPQRGLDRVVLLIFAAGFAMLSTSLGASSTAKAPATKPASNTFAARAGV